MRAAERAKERAEEMNQLKTSFLTNMTHEIRTPLNGVVSMADSLTRRPLGKQEKEMVELIRSSGVTLERLLSDIRARLKLEAHWLERGVTARRKRNQGRLAKLYEMRAARAAMSSTAGAAAARALSAPGRGPCRASRSTRRRPARPVSSSPVMSSTCLTMLSCSTPTARLPSRHRRQPPPQSRPRPRCGP